MQKLREVGSSIAHAQKEGTRKPLPDRTKNQSHTTLWLQVFGVPEPVEPERTAVNKIGGDTTTPSSPPGFSRCSRNLAQLPESGADWSAVLRLQ